MTPEDIINYVRQLNTTTDKITMAQFYIDHYNKNTLTTHEKNEIRKTKRRDYARKRYADNKDIREEHQIRMREYRLRKKKEFEELKSPKPHNPQHPQRF